MGKHDNLTQSWQNLQSRPVADQYADDGRRAINPWQTANAERRAENTHDSLTSAYQEALGRDPERGGLDNWKGAVNNGGMGLDEVRQGIAASEEAGNYNATRADVTAAAEATRAAEIATPRNALSFTSDDDMYRAAADYSFGDFTDKDRKWFGDLADDLMSKGGSGSQYLDKLGDRSFVGQKGGLTTANEQRLANLLGQVEGHSANQAEAHYNDAITPAVPTSGGISYDPHGPRGGTVNPTQTFTPHRGFIDKDGKKEGRGGGVAEVLPPRPANELIAARPDLRSSGRRPIVQAAVGPTAQPVQSIQSQMAQANALRSSGGNSNG